MHTFHTHSIWVFEAATAAETQLATVTPRSCPAAALRAVGCDLAQIYAGEYSLKGLAY